MTKAGRLSERPLVTYMDVPVGSIATPIGLEAALNGDDFNCVQVPLVESYERTPRMISNQSAIRSVRGMPSVPPTPTFSYVSGKAVPAQGFECEACSVASWQKSLQ
jgi:hypothetical protein